MVLCNCCEGGGGECNLYLTFHRFFNLSYIIILFCDYLYAHDVNHVKDKCNNITEIYIYKVSRSVRLNFLTLLPVMYSET